MRIADAHEAVFEALPDAVLVLSTEGEVLAANPAAERLLGASAESLVGRPFHTTIPSDTPVELPLAVGGRSRPVELRAAPVRWRGRRAVVATLREVGERFRQLADAAPAILWQTDVEGRCTFLSRGWYEYTGQCEGEGLGEGWLRAVHPDDRDLAAATFRRGRERGEPFEFDCRFRRADGSYGWAIDLGRPWRDVDGRLLGFVGSVIDATDRKRVEAELRTQDRRKDEFLATLAHELRNPLAPIRNGIDLLRRTPTGPHAVRTLAAMDRQVGHMHRLVDDLLDLSRLKNGKVLLRRERSDLRAVADAAVESCRGVFEAVGHTLDVESAAQPVWVDADPTRLAQVVCNLLTNAAKYTPPGGRVGLRVGVEGDHATVVVRDTGVGITDAMLEKVFDLFAQADGTAEHSQGGLGIGLSLVRRLVGLHGGTVVAESPGHGQGSTFTVRLPSAAPPSASSEESAALGTASQPCRRVLVVDDNRDGADSLAMLLQLAGYETRVSHAGEDAVAAAGEFLPHVVLCDIELPDVSGHEVARRLKADPTTRPAVLVAITGRGGADDSRNAAAAGFERLLTKPIRSDELNAVLGELCVR